MARILLVDPSLLDRKRIRAILEAAGHQVTETESPAEAMAQVSLQQRGHFHLVVTEYTFPQHDGLAFVRQLKAEQATAMSPVLVVSSRTSDKDDMFAAIQAGASNMVAKPFGGDLLLRRVTETLAESAAARQGEDGSLTWRLSDYLIREMRRSDRIQSPLSLIVGSVEPCDAATMSHVVNAMQRILRAADILAKLGDEKVVLILPDTDAAGAGVLRERLARTVGALAQEGENRPAIQVRLRTGAATYPAEGAEHDVLLRLAEERMA